MKEKFCFDILKRNEFVLKFLHVLIVEYIEALFRAKNCFDGDPSTLIDKNIEQILNKYKRRIPLINNCY